MSIILDPREGPVRGVLRPSLVTPLRLRPLGALVQRLGRMPKAVGDRTLDDGENLRGR
jgi:hypothetical protein